MNNNFLPLSQLLLVAKDTYPLAYSEGMIRTRAEWLLDISYWQAVLASKNEQVWGLFHHDAYQFSVRLLALWSLNKKVIVPANNCPETLEKLKYHVDKCLGDLPGVVENDFSNKASVEDYQEKFSVLNIEKPLLGIFTSGSSGEPEIIDKSIRQLEDELIHLNQLWPVSTHNEWCVATVSHHHIYGLLFKLLLPLCSGRVIVAKSSEFIEEALSYSERAAQLMLITSPTHLSRLPDSLFVKKGFSRIFSSGAPLSDTVAKQAEERLATVITEIYGSTETGGIAWREQNNCQYWQLLPNIYMKIESPQQCLMIRSKHLQKPKQWYTTSDRISLHDTNRFSLQGRVDAIVKIEGKRISINEMKQYLLAHEAVDDVQLIPLDGRRTELGAVIVLSEQGLQLYAENRKSLSQQLRHYLKNHYELPVIPRRWRFLSSMPVNQQGKVIKQQLESLFIKPRLSYLPTVLHINKKSDNHLELQLWIDKDLPYFDGHFSEAAVLPGIVMIHWLPHLMKMAFDFEADYKNLEAIKFQQVVLPMQEVILNLQYDEFKKRLIFSYQSPLGKHSSGKMNFL